MLYLCIEPITPSLLYHAGAPIAKHHTRCIPEPQNSPVMLLFFSSSDRVEIVKCPERLVLRTDSSASVQSMLDERSWLFCLNPGVIP